MKKQILEFMTFLVISFGLFVSSASAYSLQDLYETLVNENRCVFCDLIGADLMGADLTSIDLSYADLSYADLSYANLTGVNLSYANLTGVNLSYTDLSNVDLDYAIFCHTTMPDQSFNNDDC